VGKIHSLELLQQKTWRYTKKKKRVSHPWSFSKHRAEG